MPVLFLSRYLDSPIHAPPYAIWSEFPTLETLGILARVSDCGGIIVFVVVREGGGEWDANHIRS